MIITNKQKLKCLFGFHKWGETQPVFKNNDQPDKNNNILPTMSFIRSCAYCKKCESIPYSRVFIDSMHQTPTRCNSSDYD